MWRHGAFSEFSVDGYAGKGEEEPDFNEVHVDCVLRGRAKSMASFRYFRYRYTQVQVVLSVLVGLP